MNGNERMRAAIRGEAVDRTPVAYQFFGAAHRVLDPMGASLAQVYADAAKIASAQVAAAELFGHDTVMAPWGCMTVEAQAFGCELETFDRWYPQVRSRPLAATADLSLLHPVEASLASRMELMAEALVELRRQSAGELFVIGMVVSPFLVACELRDMSNLMVDIGRDPAFVTALLDEVTNGLIHYVDAIAATGACDGLMFENAGMSAELLGPHHVEAFVRPHHRRLVDHARRAMANTVLIEHNCGSLPYFAEIHATDVDAVSFAGPTIDGAIKGADGNVLAGIGMIDHAELVLHGTPDEVYAAATGCLERAAGLPFVLSTGCEIPFKAPVANVQAITRAARDW